MTTVKLKAALPGEDRNGLAGLAADLADNPDSSYVAVVVLQPAHQATNLIEGTTTTTLGITALEVIADAADARDAQRLLRRAHEARTGRAELPLEVENELDQLPTIDVAVAPAELAAEDEPAFGHGYVAPGFSDQ